MIMILKQSGQVNVYMMVIVWILRDVYMCRSIFNMALYGLVKKTLRICYVILFECKSP